VITPGQGFLGIFLWGPDAPCSESAAIKRDPRQLDTRTEDRDRADDLDDDPDARSRIILHDRSSLLRPHDLTETHF
jgi:hypothetical protein